MGSTTSGSNEIDLASYGSPIRFNGYHGMVLAAQLLVAAPSGLSERGRAACAKIERKSKRVKAVLTERTKGSPGGLRPLITDFDSAHGALHGRLASAARLPAGAGELGARASRLLEAVSPDGVAFLVNDVETKYAESVRRLDIASERGLEREIDEVAGVGFLAEVRRAQTALGEAIGVGVTPLRYARAELRVAVRELADAIAEYCLQLAAQVDRDDAASVEAFRAAVMPIDRFRALRTTGTEEDAEEDEEEELVVAPVGPSPSPAPSPSPLPSPFLEGAE